MRPIGVVLAVVLLAGSFAGADEAKPPKLPDVRELAKLSAKLAPVELGVDLSRLPVSERAALAAIVQAARIMDPLYLRQVWSGNQELLLQLTSDSTPLGRARLKAFLQNKGPWLRIADEETPFLPDVGAKPAAGGFYPPGSTKAELEAWMRSLPAPARAAAEGFFTTIRRGPDGKLLSVPYSVEYQEELGRAAALLREAAASTTQPTLKAFLEARAAAFLSNDYYASDVAWMKLDASIEPTIGPYETYEDGWFSAKAAFEAFVTLRDDAETTKLARFEKELQGLEDNLPIDPKLRSPKLGALAPIRVVNSIFSSGDGNRGVQTAAFNLPNDERIAHEMGTKRVMLKNVQEAKFKVVLLPISKVALAPAQRKDVSFDAFFTHILMHELMHGLGPRQAAAKGMTSRAALQETYGPIEEAKADASGLWALQRLIDTGVLTDKDLQRTVYPTFLASAFRSIRFGLKEAHAKAVAMQLNLLVEKGAVRVGNDGTFAVETTKVKDAVREITTLLMTIEADGDREKAAGLLRTHAIITPAIKRVLDKLAMVPVDIEPRYTTAEKL
jgi:hypothetical protein